MEYIYTRVSKEEQENDNQAHHLKALHPNAEVIEETISGAKEKPALTRLLTRLRRGDLLIVAALDRLGRTSWQSIKLMDDLYEKGITVKSLREGIDYSSAGGRTTARFMLVIAETERELIIERTKSALARLRAQGRVLGRPSKCAPGIAGPGRLAKLTAEQALAYRASRAETEALARSYRAEGKTFIQIRDLTGISLGKLSRLFRAA